MMSATANVPYESQSDPQNRRDCGAVCLSMVYRSLGKEASPAEIWPAIAKVNRSGSVASTTHLMAKDALSRGMAAVAFQAKHPLHALQLCCESGIRAIINHRPTPSSSNGHYSVLVDMDKRDAVLHDPFYGPSRRIPHAELLELWQPGFSNSEIAGFMLIAIAVVSPATSACWLCHAPLPVSVTCPRCKETVTLQPSGPLGCMSESCIARMWNYIYCPFCDCGFTLSSQAASDAPTQSQPAGPGLPGAQATTALRENPCDLGRMFAEIDKFCNYVLSMPAADTHPEIKNKLQFIASSKEKLKLAVAESLAHRKSHQEQLAKMAQAARENQEAQRRRAEELRQPSPPLDGNALGRALLKNLGFVE